MSKIRVFTFDDSEDRRDSLKILIESCEDMLWVGEADNAALAVELVEENKPDVVLMDIQMPGVDGLQGLAALRKKFPSLVILMQTIFEDDDKVFSSLRSGASGYILKKASPDKFIEAIRDAYHGGAPITPSIATRVLSYFTNPAAGSKPNENYNLSNREKEILQLLVDGLSYKMISDKLNISYFTVNNHIRHIYEKMHVHSQSEAVSKALREKLFSILWMF